MIHTRQVTCKGYLRDDGLFEVEGHLEDVRGVDCMDKRRVVLVPAGETLHGMRLRITVDEEMRIVEAGARTEHSPHGECRSAGKAYAALEGLVIGPGFLAAARERFRGVQGCTHLTELVGPVATTAIQTAISAREQQAGQVEQKGPQMSLVDSCVAWRRGGEAFHAHTDEKQEVEQS
ncbi:hypothetical protein AYR66_05445 [Noviherbaspirillum denitrificans]|uniref:Molybdopterin-guanine dinucleotide biosynthesis protein MobB n=1 Tax=Noviherbaspirillum denitrificans TaxID=1968433 RepID=A0A254T8Q3_9BURK|nr:hypothetical protein AYR66_05445 [Noviherbaspirillum denitrificans]